MHSLPLWRFKLEEVKQEEKAALENELKIVSDWNAGLANVVLENDATVELNDVNQEAAPQLGKDIAQSDRQLLFLIQKYKRAERICQEAGIKLSDLRERYAFLVYKLKKFIEIEGLYRETSPVNLKDSGIQITRDHLIESGFEVGDRFKVNFKDGMIVLSKLQGSES
jgi:hypothetical protein